MSDDHHIDISDANSVREMLLGSGYSEKAIDYYLNRPDMGSLSDADHVVSSLHDVRSLLSRLRRQDFSSIPVRS